MPGKSNRPDQMVTSRPLKTCSAMLSSHSSGTICPFSCSAIKKGRLMPSVRLWSLLSILMVPNVSRVVSIFISLFLVFILVCYTFV